MFLLQYNIAHVVDKVARNVKTKQETVTELLEKYA